MKRVPEGISTVLKRNFVRRLVLTVVVVCALSVHSAAYAAGAKRIVVIKVYG